MPKKANRPDARRDANEPDIVAALKEAGYVVERITGPGDLLVWVEEIGGWVLLEVKMPDGRLTKAQIEFREKHPEAQIPVVRYPNQAMDVLREASSR